MSPSLPWLQPPIMLHSSRDPGVCSMTPEQCAYKSRYWVFWYEADHRYSLPTVALFLVAIILFTIARFATKVAPRTWKKKPIWLRLVAVGRFLAYKSWRIGTWNSQPLGYFLLGAVGVIFFFAMTLGPRPYYWPSTRTLHYANSPPIATRTGFMALACLPFLIMLGTKTNPITLFTGVSYERLVVWHNWVAWAMFVLALIHTFPFIIYHIWNGDIVAQWNDGGTWVTGVIAIIAQAWLTFMSIPWIRNRYYEFFKATHLLAALAFVIFFFLHCGGTLSSWDYFIATAVIYTLCWCYSQCKTYFEHGVRHKACLVMETEHTLRITIHTRAEWTPCQHIFLRFLTCGVHALTAHPFTVCSVPQPDHKNQLVFYVQPRGGVTRNLMSMAKKQPNIQVPVLLDGPYGGMIDHQITAFSKSLVVGGGAGAGFTLSMVEAFISLALRQTGAEMNVVIATRDPAMRIWYIQALEDMAGRYSEDNIIVGLSIHIHETGLEQPISTESVDVSKSEDDPKMVTADAMATEVFSIRFLRGRPDLKVWVQQLASQADESVGLVVCGPSSMTYDVGEAASAAQRRILAKEPGIAREVWLHKESFSY